LQEIRNKQLKIWREKESFFGEQRILKFEKKDLDPEAEQSDENLENNSQTRSEIYKLFNDKSKREKWIKDGKKTEKGETEQSDSYKKRKETREIIEKLFDKKEQKKAAENVKNKIESATSVSDLRKLVREEAYDLGIMQLDELAMASVAMKMFQERVMLVLEKQHGTREQQRLFDQMKKEREASKDVRHLAKEVVEKHEFMEVFQQINNPKFLNDNMKKIGLDETDLTVVNHYLPQIIRQSDDYLSIDYVLEDPVKMLEVLKSIKSFCEIYSNTQESEYEEVKEKFGDQIEKLDEISQIIGRNEDAFVKNWGFETIDDLNQRIHDSKSKTENVLSDFLAESPKTKSDKNRIKLADAILKDEESKYRWSTVLKNLLDFEEKKNKPEGGKDDIGGDEKELPKMNEKDRAKSSGFDKLKSAITKVTKAGGTSWYSFHDIAVEFKEILDVIKSVHDEGTDDFTGAFKSGVTKALGAKYFSKRVEGFVDGARQTAEKNKKILEGYKLEDLIHELESSPTYNRTRGIILVLAENGNLQMSNRPLMEALFAALNGYNKVTEDDWQYARRSDDYSRIRAHFTAAVSHANSFEPDLGNEFLKKQADGFGQAEEKGTKIATSTTANTPGVEYRLWRENLKKSSVIGEGSISGMLKTIKSRGNLFAGNGKDVSIDVHVEGAEKPHNAELSLGTVALDLISMHLRGNISADLISHIATSNEKGLNNFCVLKEVLSAKNIKKGNRYVSQLEDWGWIDSQRGTITALGLKELPRFFDTRNAKAIVDGEEDIIHIKTHTGSYKTHAGRRRTIGDVRKDVEGDKILFYVTKGATLDVYKHATTFEHGEHANASTDEIASLFKGALEEFADGVDMLKNSNKKATQTAGKTRIKFAKDAINLMLKNMHENLEDRSVYQEKQRSLGGKTFEEYFELLLGEEKNNRGADIYNSWVKFRDGSKPAGGGHHHH